MSRTAKAAVGFSVIAVVITLIGLFVYFCLWLNLIRPYQLGYWVDTSTGEVRMMVDHGWVRTSPMKRVYTIDLRPEQVCMYAYDRTVDCKTVRFDPQGFDEFVMTYGPGDYAFPSVHSSSTGTTRTDLGEILKYHAFDVTRDPPSFIRIESRLIDCPN